VYLLRTSFRATIEACRSRFIGAISTACKHLGKPRRDAWSQKCQCPIWVQGSLGGEYLRRSLDLVSWQAAQDRVRGWEATGEIGVVKSDVPDILDAVDASSPT